MSVKYTVECLEEDTLIRGSVIDSGDPEYDKAEEDRIVNDYNSGNPWAWCCVKVIATLLVDGQLFDGCDYLGTCSYADEGDFKADRYYKDMCDRALADLKMNIAAAIVRGEVAHKALKTIS